MTITHQRMVDAVAGSFGKCESEYAAARIAILCLRDGDWKRTFRASDMKGQDEDELGFEKHGFIHLIVGGFLNPVDAEVDRTNVEYFGGDIIWFPPRWLEISFSLDNELVRRFKAKLPRSVR